jgi:hypothetical protein
MTEKKTQNSNPWEDALILAFRDLQWIVKQEINSTDVWQLVHELAKAKRIPELPERLKELLKIPPPLLAKLDGNAESASGDVLTAHNDRFFLLEFKSGRNKFHTENGKFILRLMQFADPDHPLHAPFLELSRNGHFVVYPELSETSKHWTNDGFLPVHEATLYAQPYFDALTGKERASTDHNFEIIAASEVKNLVWGSNAGLSLEQMAAYLIALCTAHREDGAEGHPIKIVIASADGIYWPMADLAELIQFTHYFHKRKNLSQDFQLYRKSLSPFTDEFKNQSNTHPSTEPDPHTPKFSSMRPG